MVEAAARGAMESIAVIASIMVNLIAFIALMAFLDALLGYLGSLIGYPELCFQVSCAMKNEPQIANSKQKLLVFRIVIIQQITVLRKICSK